jgi:hypothetical protein
LRDAQQEDFQHKQIPAGATDGSVAWIRLDNVPVMGRLVVLARRGGVVSGFDCWPCPCLPDYDLDRQPRKPCSLQLTPIQCQVETFCG